MGRRRYGGRPPLPRSCFDRTMAAGQAYLSRVRAPGRAVAGAVAGAFLPGAQPALAATTATTVALLVASEGAQDGEGQAEVVCEQPVFAAVRAAAALPAGAAGEQVRAHSLSLITLEGHGLIQDRLSTNALLLEACWGRAAAAAAGAEAAGCRVCCPSLSPLLAPFCPQDLLALLTDSGFLSILRFDAALARWVLERGGRALRMRSRLLGHAFGALVAAPPLLLPPFKPTNCGGGFAPSWRLAGVEHASQRPPMQVCGGSAAAAATRAARRSVPPVGGGPERRSCGGGIAAGLSVSGSAAAARATGRRRQPRRCGTCEQQQRSTPIYI